MADNLDAWLTIEGLSDSEADMGARLDDDKANGCVRRRTGRPTTSGQRETSCAGDARPGMLGLHGAAHMTQIARSRAILSFCQVRWRFEADQDLEDDVGQALTVSRGS